MFIPIFLIGRSDCQLDRQQRESSRAVGNRIRAFPASAMAPAMAIVSASSVTTRSFTPARVVAGGRRPAAARVPAAASSASSRNDSIARRIRGRVDSGRGVAAAAFNFKNPFGGKSEPEDDADEAGDGAAYVDDAVDGNPFLSKSNRPTPSSDERDDAAPELKLPKLPANPFASFGAKAAEPEDEEDAYEEEEEAFEEPAKSGSPFGNPFASFGAMNQTIDQTVDLDYGDDEDDFEEPKKGGFGGFALPSFPAPAKKEAKPSKWEKKFLRGGEPLPGARRSNPGRARALRDGYSQAGALPADVNVAAVENLIAQRVQAKLRKDFDEADALQEQLKRMGVRVNDRRRTYFDAKSDWS